MLKITSNRRRPKYRITSTAIAAVFVAFVPANAFALDSSATMNSDGILVIGDACDPGLKEAAAQASQTAAQKLNALMDEVIGSPMSIEELACLDNMFSLDFGLGIDIPGMDEIMDSILQQACYAAESAWDEINSRLSESVNQSLSVGQNGVTLPGGVELPGFGASANVGVGGNGNKSLSDILTGSSSPGDLIDMDIEAPEDIIEETYENSRRSIDLLRSVQ